MRYLRGDLFHHTALLVLLLLCSILAVAKADSVYSVILNVPGTDTGVIINNKVYVLHPSSKSPILFQGKAPSYAPYSYAVLERGTTNVIKQENFARSPIAKDHNTVNEFYNRNWNTKELVRFETISSITKNFNRRPNNSLLHPIGEIPTIHVIAAQSDLDNMHEHYQQDITISANVTYISTKSVQVFSDAKFEIGGRSSRLFTKFAYNIKLPKKDDQYLGGYKKLKLRTTVSDPSYMREYLATEMLHAANQPSSRASYVRVFLNGRAVGLYSLLEKYDDTWLANEFGPSKASQNKKYANGILYEGEGGKKDQNRADLSYKGENQALYNASAYAIDEKPAKGPNDFTELIAFTKFINDQLILQKSGNKAKIYASTTEWEKRIDVEGFLVNMAFEFIHGFWDGYLQNTDNFFLYKSPEQNRFIYISWDFDYVMGSGPVNMKAISVGDYNSYGGVKSRPLMVAILNVPKYRSLFERHLQSIIDTLYEPAKSFPVIDSVVDLIRDDVAWDKSLPHIRKGLEYLTTDVNNLIGANPKDANAGTPISLSLTTAAEFLLRLNADISFAKAVNGDTGHVSLYGVKEWIQVKLDSIKRKTKYKPLLPFLHLKKK